MKRNEKQHPEPRLSKEKMVVSGDDENSIVEKSFSLLTERGSVSKARLVPVRCQGEDQGKREEDEGEREEGNSEAASSGAEDEDGHDDDDEEENDLEDASGSREIQSQEDMRKELSNMSFEDILKLQNKVGTKVYSQIVYGHNKSQETKKNKRLNKNRPVEISAKRPVSFLRQVVPVKTAMLRDPRFDDLSGEYKPEIFEKTYKFIDDIKSKEKQILQKQLKKTKKNKRMEQLHFLLKRMENQEQTKKNREQQKARELQLKRQQREQASQGARPFFLKKSEKKKLQLAEKYLELKKNDKLENFLSKKRMRNAGKDRRRLPKGPHSNKDS